MPLHRGTVASGFLGVVPGPPGGLTATTCANSQSVLSWSAPSTNGGSAVTDYVVQYSTTGTGGWSTFSDGVSASTGTTVTGLSNGTTYYFQVAAVNTYGTGSYSSVSTVITPATVPNAPTSVSGTSGTDGESSVSWVAPSGAGTGGASISSYNVQYSTDGTNWTTSGTSASSPKTVSGLSNGTPYYFRVLATNCAGNSVYSTASATATPYGAPGTPGAPTLTAGDSTDRFSWTAASPNGSAITGYRWQVSNDNGVTWYSTIGGTFDGGYGAIGWTTTTNLYADLPTQYRTDSWKLRVRAVNAYGLGANTGISTSGTSTWSFGSMTDTGTCASFSCTCATCDCGTSTGTNTTASGTRTCYRYTRSGSTSGPLRNSNNTAACSGAYGSCTGGSCTSCTGCASYTSAPKTGNFSQGGLDYTYTGTPGSYYVFPNPNCSSGCDFSAAYYSVTTCNGTNTITPGYSEPCLNVFGDPC